MQRGTDRSSTCWSPLNVYSIPVWDWPKPAWNSHQVNSWVAKAQGLRASTAALTGSIGRELDGKLSSQELSRHHMGCQCCRWQLNPPGHRLVCISLFIITHPIYGIVLLSTQKETNAFENAHKELGSLLLVFLARSCTV